MTVDHEEIEMMHLLSQSLEANARKEASAVDALLKALDMVSKEGVREGIRKRLGARGGKEMAEANIEAFERAYNEVTGV